MNRVGALACGICAALIAVSAVAGAEPIRDIVLVGSTINIDVRAIPGVAAGNLGDADIRSVGARVTAEYHRLGYTTSYVERLVVRKDGTLDVHVRESRIAGIEVTGIGARDARELESLLFPVKNEIYNKLVIQDRMKRARELYNLDTLRVVPVNYKDSDDVFLSVRAERTSAGRFSGGVVLDPIYGIGPLLGWRMPSKDSDFSVTGTAGYRANEWRKIAGDLRYSRRMAPGEGALALGMRGGRTIEQWQSRGDEFTVTSCAPSVGIGVITDVTDDFLLWTTVSIAEIVNALEDYSERGGRAYNYDTRLTLDVLLSNRYYKMEKNTATEMHLALSGGRSGLEKKGYVIAVFDASTSAPCLSWLRLIPRCASYYTSSKERLYHSYVFDAALMGFSNDYTASKWKNTAGLDVEAGLLPGMLYVGPFVNAGCFLDERNYWRAKTGTGAKCRIRVKSAMVQLYYAWNAAGPPKNGGMYISASGDF